MNYPDLILLLILALGIVSRNNLLAVSTCGLLLLSLLKLDDIILKLDKFGLNVGIVILMMGVMAPIAMDKIDREVIIDLIKSPRGIIALASGLAVTILAGRGTQFLKSSPEVVIGILVGTIAGIGFFKGTPVGPLIGAGIATVLLNIYNFISSKVC